MENCKDLKSSIFAIFIDKLNVKKKKKSCHIHFDCPFGSVGLIRKQKIDISVIIYANKNKNVYVLYLNLPAFIVNMIDFKKITK